MKTITVETSQLSGAALDWAVAKAVGHVEGELHDDGYWSGPDYSTDWSQGGPLIEKLEVLTPDVYGNWYAMPAGEYEVIELSGPTPLIAICRAIVAAELGDDVEVPAGLVEVKNG